MEELELYRKHFTSVKDDRNTYIGGSDVGTILGVNPYKSAYTLYLEKTGQIETPDISDEEPVWWGTEMEDLVAKRFLHKAKEAGHRISLNRTNFERRSKKYPFLVAHIDREVNEYIDDVFYRVGLECKTTSSWNKTNYEEGDIPAAHYAQVQFYMMMSDAPYWFYAVKRDSEFHWCKVQRDDEYIDAMLKAVIDFWNHVQAKDDGIPVGGSESSTQSLNGLYKADKDEMADLNGYTAYFELIEELDSNIKSLEEAKENAKNIIRHTMGTASAGLVEGYSVTWKEQTSGKFDSKKFRKDHPDLYEEYTNSTTTRVLRINRKKEKK